MAGRRDPPQRRGCIPPLLGIPLFSTARLPGVTFGAHAARIHMRDKGCPGTLQVMVGTVVLVPADDFWKTALLRESRHPAGSEEDIESSDVWGILGVPAPSHFPVRFGAVVPGATDGAPAADGMPAPRHDDILCDRALAPAPWLIWGSLGSSLPPLDSAPTPTLLVADRIDDGPFSVLLAGGEGLFFSGPVQVEVDAMAAGPMVIQILLDDGVPNFSQGGSAFAGGTCCVGPETVVGPRAPCAWRNLRWTKLFPLGELASLSFSLFFSFLYLIILCSRILAYFAGVSPRHQRC